MNRSRPPRSFRLRHLLPLASFLPLFALCPLVRAATGSLPGDVNADGRVDVADAVWTLQAGTNLRRLSPEAHAAADVTWNGAVNVEDAVRILRHIGFRTPLTPSGPLAGARFSVDVQTKKVKVTPLPTPSGASSGAAFAKAVFTGDRIGFNSSTLVDEPGNTGVKILNVSLTNRSGFPLGQLPNGTVTGLKVLFSDFTNLSAYPDIRSRTTVTTLAGTGAVGSADGPALSATFQAPSGVAAAADGTVYVVDNSGNTIRKISAGQVSTLAGSGAAASVNGAGTAASFNGPWGIAYSPTEDALFVTEFGNHRIRRVTRDGLVTTAAGTGAVGSANGAGSAATFNQPMGIAVGTDGAVYVTEAAGNKVRKLVKSGSAYTVSTLAGSGAAGSVDGTGAGATFNSPRAVAVGSDGVIYVTDSSNNKIRRIDPSGAVVTIAGIGASGTADGAGNVARFASPQGIAVVNGALAVSDSTTHRLRQLTLKPGGSPAQASSWVVQTLAGTGAAGSADGSGAAATFNGSRGLAADGGAVLVADYSARKVRRVTPDNGYFPIGAPSPTAQTEPVQLSNADGTNPILAYMGGVVQKNQPYLRYPDRLENGSTGPAKPWAFVVPEGVNAFDFNVLVEADTATLAAPVSVPGTFENQVGSPDVYVRTLAGADQSGYLDGPAGQARFRAFFGGVAVDAAGVLYVTDQDNLVIRRIGTDGMVTTIAGLFNTLGSVNGPGNLARFFYPQGIAVTPDGKTIYVADRSSHIIRRMALTGPNPADAASWTVSTIAGTPNTPKVALTLGTTDRTTGNNAQFSNPSGIALDGGGNVYVTEEGGNRVRLLRHTGGDPADSQNWYVMTAAGSISGDSGSANGSGSGTSFQKPTGIAVDRNGSVYVTEYEGNRVRKITNLGGLNGGTVTTLAGSPTSLAAYQDGVGTDAYFYLPTGIAVDSSGYVYVAERGNQRIRRISPTGVVTTVAGGGVPGVDGPGNTAGIFPTGYMTVDGSGMLFFAESNNGARIRSVQRIFR